jgi:hypothetical protein
LFFNLFNDIKYCQFKLPQVGLEPTRISASAPKADVATITPLGHFSLGSKGLEPIDFGTLKTVRLPISPAPQIIVVMSVQFSNE